MRRPPRNADNAVLRGLDAGNDFLNKQLVTLCCSTEASRQYADGTLPFEAAKEHMNTYTTTLNVLNSALLKLCKLTQVDTVYRGISGRKLPASFWKPDKFGARGGIEPAFMVCAAAFDPTLFMRAMGRARRPRARVPLPLVHD